MPSVTNVTVFFSEDCLLTEEDFLVDWTFFVSLSQILYKLGYIIIIEEVPNIELVNII